jgi:hypothetical protein
MDDMMGIHFICAGHLLLTPPAGKLYVALSAGKMDGVYDY